MCQGNPAAPQSNRMSDLPDKLGDERYRGSEFSLRIARLSMD